jgi:hypothetical protein
MTAKDTNSTQWDDHLEARTDVIRQYGDLWRQAVARSGVSDETATEALLQVCAACYLDGVNKGSSLGIAILVEEQLIREQAAILRSKNAALTNDEAYDLAKAAVKMKSENRSE